jgi:hypothetical protein
MAAASWEGELRSHPLADEEFDTKVVAEKVAR